MESNGYWKENRKAFMLLSQKAVEVGFADSISERYTRNEYAAYSLTNAKNE
jgi:hypothetical protein